MTLQIKPGTTWVEVYDRARAAAPEAFDADRILNLTGGDWQRSGTAGDHSSPIDGTVRIFAYRTRSDQNGLVVTVGQSSDLILAPYVNWPWSPWWYGARRRWWSRRYAYCCPTFGKSVPPNVSLRTVHCARPAGSSANPGTLCWPVAS